MAKGDTNCQSVATEISALLTPYVQAVDTAAVTSGKDLNLTLTYEQLVLFTPLYGHKKSEVLLLIDQSITRARTTTEHLNAMSEFLNVKETWHLLESALSPQERAGDVVSDLSQTIHHLLGGTPLHHFVVPLAAVSALLPGRTAYQARQISLHTQEDKPLNRFIRELIDRGYRRQKLTIEAGTFSVQGEMVDLQLPHTRERHTLTWHGNTVEQIIRHSAVRSHEAARRNIVSSLDIPPVVFPEATEDLQSLLSTYSLIKPQAASPEIPPGIIFDALRSDHLFPLTPTTTQSKSISMLYENYDRVAEYCAQHNIAPTLWCQTPVSHIPFSLESIDFTLVSESALFTAPTTSKPRSHAAGLALVTELTANKPAVHSDHGVGIFEGLQTRTINDIPREYLMLRYAAGDTLSVPVEYAHKVTPYLGEKSPVVSRLGGTLWQKTRRRAQYDAEAFARELIELARQREASTSHRYYIDPAIEEVLNTSFPHQLTVDQFTALEEIYADLQGPHTLDRLVVGDVGFGKTELALRAARHVIANGKQVALLAPTTLLVQQHSDTARQRFPDLVGQLGPLSRFATSQEQKSIREKIASGTIRLAIGTHALLSKSTTWQNLGLVIIDEEQRFGVKHKEHFKTIRATTDFLSLSATPIPRTLSMALSGLKQLSIITTPPAGRKEVLTHVTRQDDSLLKSAIQQELARHGQVYLVAPKVRSLGTVAHLVKTLVPSASFAIAHGQLPANQLANIMRRFDNQEIDVLISSSIIENGLDLPNANTIIVLQATHFGLSDLYQLRGRVGRRERQGYAYFFYNQTDLTPIQRQRLTALTEASRLGSGWSLAQRDLEIRGAGNLLGAEQSGAVNQVGVQLYLDMVHDAIALASSGTIRRQDVEIQLPLAAIIPQHYIAHDDKRSHYYQKLARSRTLDELSALMKKLTQTYGTPPPEVVNLELILRLQHVAGPAAISHIASQPITPPDEDPYWRLTVTSRDVTKTLQKLQALGTWTIRNNVLTHDLNDITTDFVRKLSTTLA